MVTGSFTRQQVSRREEDGSTTYANKPEGSVDPLNEEIVWTADPDDPPEGYEAYYMSVATSGTRGGIGKGPFEVCYICRYDYPISQMVKYNGRYYCRPQKCYEDIQ